MVIAGDVSDWGAGERSMDWSALSEAERLVKEDVGLPGVIVQDGLDMPGAVGVEGRAAPSAAGAVGAAGGYSSGLGSLERVQDAERMGMMSSNSSSSGGGGGGGTARMMSEQGKADSDSLAKAGQAIRDIESGAGLPEGRLGSPCWCRCSGGRCSCTHHHR